MYVCMFLRHFDNEFQAFNRWFQDLSDTKNNYNTIKYKKKIVCLPGYLNFNYYFN